MILEKAIRNCMQSTIQIRSD